MKIPYTKFALGGGSYLCFGLFALNAAEAEAAPVFDLPDGETKTAASKTAKNAEGEFVLSDEARETAADREDADEVFQLNPILRSPRRRM
ncbi:MAG: hypothetical protein ABF322_04720 [Lentimonas sp.]